MKVSVIIPAYNAEKYIRRSLDSTINQVYKNIEIIVVDDASTDNTKSIIRQYAEKDFRILPFYQSVNKGVSAARNIGLKAATGDYIIFVDSDDELTKDAIRRMVDLANKYNSDFIDSYHLLYYKKKNGKVVSFTENKIPKKVLVLGSINDNTEILTMNTYITGKLIKRQLLNNLTFDESLKKYEDLVLEHQMKVKIENYVFMNKTIYLYYQREDSLVNTLGEKHLCYLYAAKKVKEIYFDYDDEIKNTINARLFQNMIFTLFTKVIKNGNTLQYNVDLVLDTLEKLMDLFPNYEDNPKINKFIKKKIKVYTNNHNKLKKFIKKINRINFINLYFKFLSIINKYEIKDPLA